MVGQRDQAMTAMRSYQEQCDRLRGDIAAQEDNIAALKKQVRYLLECVFRGYSFGVNFLFVFSCLVILKFPFLNNYRFRSCKKKSLK